jgi:hypothetical protein
MSSTPMENGFNNIASTSSIATNRSVIPATTTAAVTTPLVASTANISAQSINNGFSRDASNLSTSMTSLQRTPQLATLATMPNNPIFHSSTSSISRNRMFV